MKSAVLATHLNRGESLRGCVQFGSTETVPSSTTLVPRTGHNFPQSTCIRLGTTKVDSCTMCIALHVPR